MFGEKTEKKSCNLLVLPETTSLLDEQLSISKSLVTDSYGE